MIEDIVDLELPVDERLVIRRNRLQPQTASDAREAASGKKLPRIAVVTGVHGDELEGQYVCALLAQQVQAESERLRGIVDIYPAINPLGIDAIERSIPYLELDMNRYFAGEQERNDSYIAHLTDSVTESLTGADLVIDIHASNIYLREIPQIRMDRNTAERLLPLARLMNVDFIWIHEAITVLKSTLAHTLNARNTPTLVVEMGVGMRVTPKFCQDLVRGIFRVMTHLGIWDHPNPPKVKNPIECNEGEVSYVNSPASGLFLPDVEHWIGVEQGELLGRIVQPLTGDVVAEIRSPGAGTVFTLREYPVVMEGSLLARVFTAAPEPT